METITIGYGYYPINTVITVEVPYLYIAPCYEMKHRRRVHCLGRVSYCSSLTIFFSSQRHHHNGACPPGKVIDVNHFPGAGPGRSPLSAPLCTIELSSNYI